MTPDRTASKTRLESIDVVRGLVMILMLLDHSRDFFGHIGLNPHDARTTTFGLFATRWVTHFCAPAFVFLAGTSAALSGTRRSARERTWHLALRGIWLILLELTVVNVGWTHQLPWQSPFLQVIWAIGFSLLALAFLQHLGRSAALLLGLGLLVAQHLVPLDLLSQHSPWLAALFGPPQWIPLGEGFANLNYSGLVWLGVMLLGFGSAGLFERPHAERRKAWVIAGFASLALFLLLRTLPDGAFGTHPDWGAHEMRDQLEAAGREGWGWTVVAWLNCAKYPPSLAYLSMTLGPIFLALAWFDRPSGPLTRRVQVFGRVPLFFYLLHIHLVHLGARVLYKVDQGSFLSPMHAVLDWPLPEDFGFPLSVAYAGWIGCLLLLYPACVLFERRKRRGKHWIWSYL